MDKDYQKKEFKQQFKPWITIGSHKPIKRRDRILQQFINTKDESKKVEFHNRFQYLTDCFPDKVQ